MTTKEELVSNIKEWISHDDKIKKLQAEIKSNRDRKKILTISLINIMKSNEIDCVDINNGKILFCQNKVKTPLTKKSLLLSLEKYFNNNPNIDHSDVSNFIMENRETIIKENIKRK